MSKSIYGREHRILARLLKEARQRTGLRQSEVAEQLGQPQSFVSKYEAGERRLDVIELRKLCHVLGLALPAFIAVLEAEIHNNSSSQ